MLTFEVAQTGICCFLHPDDEGSIGLFIDKLVKLPLLGYPLSFLLTDAVELGSHKKEDIHGYYWFLILKNDEQIAIELFAGKYVRSVQNHVVSRVHGVRKDAGKSVTFFL